MYSKILLVLLSSFLLVQSSMGNAIPAAEETEAEKPHGQLFIYVLKKLMELADVTLISGKTLLQDVVDEISALENNDEEVTELLEKYNKLIADIKELDTRNDSDEMMDKFFFMSTLQKLTSKMGENEDNREATSVEKQFQESLEKHGLKDLEKEYENRFEEFAKDFIAESDKTIEVATLEDWPEKNKYIEWFNEFKSEKDVDKRNDMFDNFLGFFL